MSGCDSCNARIGDDDERSSYRHPYDDTTTSVQCAPCANKQAVDYGYPVPFPDVEVVA